MKGSDRKFIPFSVQHIYQRSTDHGVIFYTVEDRIVYYTLASVNAKKHGVQVLAASLMFTHLHQSVRADRLEQIRDYLHDTNTSFARLYNSKYGRTGILFENPPGRSQKKTSKDIRSNLIYVYNNHVEKGLCKKAKEERWSFLAYADSSNPFSDSYDSKKVTKHLTKAMRLVDRRIRKHKALEYFDLEKVFANLDHKESEQFMDYVISSYKWIDFSAASSQFGSLDSMILSIDSNTGGEYDINEEYSPHKDIEYTELVSIAEKKSFLTGIYSMQRKEKIDIARSLLQMRHFSINLLKKFFHLD